MWTIVHLSNPHPRVKNKKGIYSEHAEEKALNGGAERIKQKIAGYEAHKSQHRKKHQRHTRDLLYKISVFIRTFAPDSFISSCQSA